MISLINDPCTGFTGQSPADVFGVGDEGLFAPAFHKVQDSLDCQYSCLLNIDTQFDHIGGDGGWDSSSPELSIADHRPQNAGSSQTGQSDQTLQSLGAE
jgi:hypothetical protein